MSFIGYQPQEIVVGNQTSFKIQLKEDAELLDEVVVVGYGVQTVSYTHLYSFWEHVPLSLRSIRLLRSMPMDSSFATENPIIL